MVIDQDFKIEHSSQNVHLIHSKLGTNPKTGEPTVSETTHYYPSLVSALKGYVKHATAAGISPSKDIAELVLHLKNINNTISKLCM